MLRLKLEGGLTPELMGYENQQRLVAIFEECLRLQEKKLLTYGEAFRSQGYMGNLARVLSKVARLRNMLWVDFPIESVDEPITDSVGDLINLAAFFFINYEDRNKWGND